MDGEKLRQTIPPTAMLAGLVLGSVQILTVCYMWLAIQTFGFAGASMSVVGIVLIGLPLWKHFRVSLGTKGVSLEAAMKLSVLAEGYGENKAMTRSSLEPFWDNFTQIP
jgi:hypothetical protein